MGLSLKKLGQTFQNTYRSAGSYLMGGPGWVNGALAMGEAYGGLLSQQFADEAQAEANAQNMQINRENIALQREFAQNGIRWRVEDAKAAGLSPLAALGAGGASYSPSSISVMPDMSDANGVAAMGQGIGRALQAGRTAEEQEYSKLQLANAKADLDGKIVDNQIRAAQLQKLQAPGTGPGLPSPQGQAIPGQRGLQRIKPAENTAHAPGLPHQEAGIVSEKGWARTSTGVVPVPSKDMKERIEDNFIQESLWALKNNVMPNIGRTDPPPRDLLPKGATGWQWSHNYQEYQPVYPDKRRKFGSGGYRE